MADLHSFKIHSHFLRYPLYLILSTETFRTRVAKHYLKIRRLRCRIFPKNKKKQNKKQNKNTHNVALSSGIYFWEGMIKACHVFNFIGFKKILWKKSSESLGRMDIMKRNMHEFPKKVCNKINSFLIPFL